MGGSVGWFMSNYLRSSKSSSKRDNCMSGWVGGLLCGSVGGVMSNH